MKRNIIVLLVAVASISLTGCVTVKKVVRERVDQNVSGNQGYLTGNSGDTAQEPRPADREYIDIKIELPTWEEIHAKPAKEDSKPKPPARKRITSDTDMTGNQGYLTSTSNVNEQDLPVYDNITTDAVMAYEYEEVEAEVVSDDEVVLYEEEAIRPAYKEYTVKRGDTLSHIAKAFYDKASKWTVIYEANADKLKDPSTVLPGTVLIIPDLEEAESKYIK